ncbi:response regulator [Brevundimonas sp.]|uniref:response regulator n=1 Tax=Brevundimonas sp. TaxID=1871086 RepID=UPI00286A7494|nr:response regulator [Brevundimonas sp.]
MPDPSSVAAWNCLKRPVWLYDPQTGRKPYANPAALALFGAASLDALAARDFSARSPAIKARIRRLVDRTADGETVRERWTFFPHGQPVTAEATVSALTDEEGQLLLLFEAAPEDIPAEERRAAEALRHASAVISLFDGEGRRLFSNPAAFRAYGDAEENFACRFAEPAEGLAMLAAASRAPVSGLRAVLTRHGTRWHHMDARSVPDPVTGRPCVLLNEQDVTPRVEAELARSAAEQKATMAEARQRFLTEMSHELRTPLNAVLGFSRLLSEAGLDEVSTDQAQRIHVAGQGLVEVVNRMIADPMGEATAADAAKAVPAIMAAPDEPACGAGSAEVPLRALYVDDNDSNRTLIRAMLATMGIVCETADNGHAGVLAAAAGDWDVILMDIQMPVMCGVEATRRIRALDGLVAGTPIIALTANTLDAQIQTYVEAGMDDCVAKPVNMVELLTKTSHWGLSGRRETVASAGLSARA